MLSSLLETERQAKPELPDKPDLQSRMSKYRKCARLLGEREKQHEGQSSKTASPANMTALPWVLPYCLEGTRKSQGLTRKNTCTTEPQSIRD